MKWNELPAGMNYFWYDPPPGAHPKHEDLDYEQIVFVDEDDDGYYAFIFGRSKTFRVKTMRGEFYGPIKRPKAMGGK